MGATHATDWLSNTPLPVLAVAVPALMILALVAGAALGARLGRREARVGGDTSLEGYMIQAVLGLLALLLAFTFALSIDRFESRRRLVVEEANAIGTIYLRAQLLEEPHRSRISRMLVDYTATRLDLAAARAQAAKPLLAKNDALVTELWAATIGAAATIKDPGVSNAFVLGMNSLVDMDTARKAARSARVPVAVFVVLFVYLIVTAGVLGYVFVGEHGRVVAGFWLVLLTLFLLLVFDIDRPNSGKIREEQGPMEQLLASLKAQPPAAFDRYRAVEAMR